MIPSFRKSLKRQTVEEALDRVRGPDGKGLVHAGLVEAIVIDDGRVTVALAIAQSDQAEAQDWQKQAAATLSALPGVKKATVVLTAETTPGPQPAEVPPTAAAPQRVRKGARLSEAAMAQGKLPDSAAALSATLPGIGAVVAVASAKGGVGKSTVAVNLATALARAGQRVGVLDVDIYGPSLPTMLGTLGADPATNPEKKLLPVQAHGLKTMSIGYMVDPDAPMVWRGPIVASAIRQMLNDVAWAPLDVLIMDTPPGTGDAQLTIAQSVPLSGAVIVSTPQQVALADVRRGAAMFAKTHVPVLGIIQNMAYLEQTDGSRQYVFGEGGAERTALALGLPFLGDVPLMPALRQSSDDGVPLVDGPVAKTFDSLALATLEQLENQTLKPPPTIVFED